MDDEKRENDFPGAKRAFLVTLGSFLCQGMIGLNYCYAVFYEDIQNRWEERGVSNSFGKAAFVGSLAMGILFLASSLAGILSELIGIRHTTFIGGCTVSIGMLLSSFCVNNVLSLSFCYGFLIGIGSALIFTPSIAVLGQHFKKHLGAINGIAMTGMTIFSIVIPYAVSSSLQQFGIKVTLQILSAVCVIITITTYLLFGQDKTTKNALKPILRDICDFSVFTNKKYVIWIISIMIATLGSTVPYIYTIDLVVKTFGHDVDKNLSVACMAVSQLIGQVTFGIVGDCSTIRRLTLQGISLFWSGIFIIIMPFISTYPMFIVTIMMYGFFDGGCLSVVGPVAFEICGKEHATRALGFMLSSAAIPMTLGPSFTGVILEKSRSYHTAYVLAGIPTVISSWIMFSAKFVEIEEIHEKHEDA